MHSGLKSIYFNIHESIFLKIWIHFNSFKSILVCWDIRRSRYVRTVRNWRSRWAPFRRRIVGPSGGAGVAVATWRACVTFDGCRCVVAWREETLGVRSWDRCESAPSDRVVRRDATDAWRPTSSRGNHPASHPGVRHLEDALISWVNNVFRATWQVPAANLCGPTPSPTSFLIQTRFHRSHVIAVYVQVACVCCVANAEAEGGVLPESRVNTRPQDTQDLRDRESASVLSFVNRCSQLVISLTFRAGLHRRHFREPSRYRNPYL